jgi:hypothetical protein
MFDEANMTNGPAVDMQEEMDILWSPAEIQRFDAEDVVSPAKELPRFNLRKSLNLSDFLGHVVLLASPPAFGVR